MVIGDADPEDVYDATDPIPVRLAVIGLVVAAVLLERGTAPARAERRRADAIRVLRNVLADLQAL